MSNYTVTLTNNKTGESIELPVEHGTSGAPVIDIKRLYAEFGHFTLDPGFKATASCRSAITFIDGDKGELLYRGYPVEQLAEQCNFLEVAYLLLHGQLPDESQHHEFTYKITRHTMINESLRKFYDGFHYDAHPMAIMNGVVGSLAAFYHDGMDIHDPERRLMTARRVLAKMPTIAAGAYKHSIGEPIMYPRNDLSFTGNFLYMMYGRPSEEYEVDPIAEKAIDTLFILHADHEQNASTSTVRLAGSSQTNPYSAIAAGCASLWGPAHGGANEAVIRMLNDIGSVDQIDKFVAKAKDKDDPFRLMGFGHRVYKNYDPRAKVIKGIADDVLKQYGSDPRLELAKRLEEVALSDPYFVERKLYPNVDFYSGIIYQALGIPLNMFTVMFALGRAIGWISHWHEMMGEENLLIGRPRQLYVGEAKRDVMALNQRK